MSGLEQLDISGPEHLKEALTNCEDPIAAIEEFQTQNSVLLPSLRSALLLLDLHDVKRLDFHRSIMEDLRERLLTRISELAVSEDRNRFRTLGELLERSLPAIKVPELQPVVLALMKHIPNLKADHLKILLENSNLYNAADISVKQQIWQGNQPKFGDEISSLLSQYVDVQEDILYKAGSEKDFFMLLPKVRRQHNVLLDIVKMIGKNIRLYDMVLQFLRTLFLRTRNVHYCTLRAELLMAFHDMKITDIFQEDPCYKFTWCLDACIQECFVDSKRAKELVSFLDSVRKGREEILGDLAMILCDPHAMHTIGVSLMQCMNVSLSNDSLPRSNEDLILLLRLLSLGFDAWNIIENQQFVESKMNPSVVTRFMPCILSIMVDEAAIQLAKTAEEKPPQFSAMPDYLTEGLENSGIASLIYAYYLCDIINRGSQAYVLRSFALLSHCERDTIQSDPVLHLIVSSLIRQSDYLTNVDFCDIVFDKFFVPAFTNENVCRHAMRLIGAVHKKLPTARLNDVIGALHAACSKHGKEMQVAVNNLRDKIDSSQPSGPIDNL